MTTKNKALLHASTSMGAAFSEKDPMAYEGAVLPETEKTPTAKKMYLECCTCC
jgi:hypothetical protein